MTKRQILMAVCENPGWYPPSAVEVDDQQGAEQHLRVLLAEGWITHRLDGYEALPLALEHYPDFEGKGDLEDPELERKRRDRHITQPSPEESDQDWIEIPTTSIAGGQKIETAIDLGPIRGSVLLTHNGPLTHRSQVDVRVRVRNFDLEVEP